MATPSPIRATRNCTTTDTWLTSASGQSTRKVVGIAMTAMSRGTSAIREPKTRNSTTSAPTPPRSVSTSTLGPSPPSSPLASASMPVIRTGAPATSRLAASARAWSSARPAGSNAVSAGGYQITPKVARPSSETKVRSPVVAKSAAREPGTEAAMREKAAASRPARRASPPSCPRAAARRARSAR